MIKNKIILIRTILSILTPFCYNLNSIIQSIYNTQNIYLTTINCLCMNEICSKTAFIFNNILIKNKYLSIIKNNKYVRLNNYVKICCDMTGTNKIKKTYKLVHFSTLLIDNFFIIHKKKLLPYNFTEKMYSLEIIKNLLFIQKYVIKNIKVYKKILKKTLKKQKKDKKKHKYCKNNHKNNCDNIKIK